MGAAQLFDSARCVHAPLKATTRPLPTIPVAREKTTMCCEKLAKSAPVKSPGPRPHGQRGGSGATTSSPICGTTFEPMPSHSNSSLPGIAATTSDHATCTHPCHSCPLYCLEHCESNCFQVCRCSHSPKWSRHPRVPLSRQGVIPLSHPFIIPHTQVRLSSTFNRRSSSDLPSSPHHPASHAQARLQPKWPPHPIRSLQGKQLSQSCPLLPRVVRAVTISCDFRLRLMEKEKPSPALTFTRAPHERSRHVSQFCRNVLVFF